MSTAPTVGEQPRLLVPAYFHPAVRPQDWSALAEQAQHVALVVLNVATGPGEQRDPAFDPVLDQLRAARIRIAGYIDTGYATRPTKYVLSDLWRYHDWYATDAVFFDRVAGEPEHVDHYAALAHAARALGAATVMFNHGSHPTQAYAAHADLLGTFEGPWSAYIELAIPTWARQKHRVQVVHLVHSVPPTLIGTALDLAAQRNASCVYITHHSGPNPWRRLCSRLHHES